MSTCPSCGRPVKDGAGFCPNCGKALSAPPPAPPAPKFCTKCGEAIPSGVEFCPNCGANLRAKSAPAPEKKPSSKGKTAGIAAALVAVILLGVAAGAKFLPGLLQSKPGDSSGRGPGGSSSSAAEEKLPEESHKQFMAYQEKLFLEPMLASMEKADRLIPQSFATDLTITASVDNDMIQQYLTNSSIGLKLDLGLDRLTANGDVVLMGSPVLSGSVTYDHGKLGFWLPQVDENYYVMDLSRVISNLSGQQVDLSALSMPDISVKEWVSLARTYIDIVSTVVTEESVTVEEDTVDLSKLGYSFKGTVYTFTPRAKDVEAMVKKLADHLEKDKTLRGLIVKVSGVEMLSQMAGVDVSHGADFERELDQALIEAAQELRDQAESIGEDIGNGSFSWTLSLEDGQVRMIRLRSKDTGGIIALELQGSKEEGTDAAFYIRQDGEDQLLFTAGSKKADSGAWEYTFQLEADGDTALSGQCTKTGSVYDGTLTFGPFNGSSLTVDYQADEAKKSPLGLPYGEYDITLTDAGEEISASMKVSAAANGGADHTITMKGFRDETDGMFDRVDLNINATGQTTATLPSGPSRDISNYTPEQLQNLFMDLGDTLEQDLLMNLMPLIYGYEAY